MKALSFRICLPLLGAALLAGCGHSHAPLPSGTGDAVPALPAAPAAPAGQWLAGDMHVHNDHSADGSFTRQGFDQRGPGNVSIADQIGQGVQNGLDWMPLTDHRSYDQHYDPLWESADLLLIPGEEANGSPHSVPLAAVDMIVQGADTPDRPEHAKLQTSIWDAHSQGATWSHAHPDDGHLNDDDTPNGRHNAVGADLMEVWNKGSGIERELKYAENRWDAGYRFGVTGASDNHFRELWAIAGPGMPATSVFAAQSNERAIVQGLWAGRTLIQVRKSATPFVTLEADLQGDGIYEAVAGDEVVATAGTRGQLRIVVVDGAGTTVSLYQSPGKSAGPFKTFTPTTTPQTFLADIEAGAAHSWYYVEARGPGEVDAIDTGTLGDPTLLLDPSTGANERRAITSPIFVGPSLAEPRPDVAVPADIGGDDAALLSIGAQNQFNGFPDVVVADGVSHMVAEQHGDGSTSVIYRRRAADGKGSAETDLAPASNAARFPKIAARGNQVWVAWQDGRAGERPHRRAIYLRHSADGGNTWQPEQKLREIAGRAERPDLALLPDGRPVVVWQEISAGNPFDIMALVLGDAEPVNLSRTGKTVKAATPEDTRSARYPASIWPGVAVRSDGLVAVAFQDNRTDPDPLWTGSTLTGEDGATEVDNWQVLVVRRAPGGDWATPASLGSTERADRHPAVGFTSAGALVAAWDSKELRPAGANVSIRYAVSTDGGSTFSNAAEPAAIAEDPNTMAQYPRLGNDPGGRLRAVWYDNRSADWRWRVMTAIFDGAGWTGATLIPSRGINTWPATDGGAIVFASTRNAQRLQRDRTQQIFIAAAP